jgi:thymidylate kinase
MNNLFIIAIDGLDGTGKSTYAKKLTMFLWELFPEKKVLLQHFPVYDNKTGKEIKDFLFNDADLNDPKKVDWMIQKQAENRCEWWNDFCKLHSDCKKDIILIADRYMESNVIYNAFGLNSNFMQIKATKIRTIESSYPQPRPNIQILGFCDPRLQSIRLSRRHKKDRYESQEVVSILNKNYCQYVHWYKQWCDDNNPPILLPLTWLDTKEGPQFMDSYGAGYLKQMVRDGLMDKIFNNHVAFMCSKLIGDTEYVMEALQTTIASEEFMKLVLDSEFKIYENSIS